MYYKSMSSVLAWDLHMSDVYQIVSCDDAHVGVGAKGHSVGGPPKSGFEIPTHRLSGVF